MDVVNIKLAIGAVVAFLASFFGTWLGGFDVLLQALVVFVILDFISGLLAAYVERKWNSSVGHRGIAKKVLMFILVAVACQLDLIFSIEMIRMSVIGFYIGIEGLSVLENVGRAGLQIPGFLAKALEELRDKDVGSGR